MTYTTDEPRAGFYTCRLIRHGLKVAVRIWFGQPIIDGEEQDRAHRWCVEVDGHTDRAVRDDAGDIIGREPLDVFDVWPFCAGSQISEAEYRFLLKRKAWAVEHAPDHPAANPRAPIDVRKLPPGW